MRPAGDGRASLRWGGAIGAALAVLVAPPSVAEEIQAPTNAMAPPSEVAPPPRPERPALTLAEAVELTLRFDPAIQGEKQAVAVAMGRLQQVGGFFDPVLRVAPGIRVSRREILPEQRLREEGKRELVRIVAEEFAKVGEEIERELARQNFGPPQCPPGIEVPELNVLEGLDLGRRAALEFEDTIIVLGGDLGEQVGDFFRLCTESTARQTTLRTLDTVNDTMGLGLDELILSSSEIPRDILVLTREIAEAVATKAALAVERLGAPPDDESIKSVNLTAGYSRLFRSGLRFSFDLELRSMERNFEGKPLDPAFGGMGIRNEFPSQASFSLAVPLGKGRGVVSAAAPEAAARRALAASRERLRHTITEEVFGTVLAYVSVQALQDTVRLLEESDARQRRLVDLTGQLVDAGELARSELDRAAARAAQVAAELADARRRLVEARFALAEAIGLEVATPDEAPVASDVYPERAELEATVAALLDEALARRRDLKSIASLRDAAGILADAARADLKRRIDLFFTAGMSTLYESPIFKFFPDELDEPQPETPVRFDSARGFVRSLSERWTPFVRAELVFDLPFANNRAKGRLLREQSSLTISEIQLSDLERVIRDNVVQVAGALERVERAVERHRSAIDYYEQTLEAALALYETGEITLLDMLVTEEDLTRQRLALVRAMQTYLSLVARLRFEAGDLVRFDNEGTAMELAAFDPRGLAVSPGSP